MLNLTTYSHRWTTASIVLVFLSRFAMSTQYDTRQVYLTQVTGNATCQTFKLGEIWTSPSTLACFAACVEEFADACQSCVYNADTQACTPGSTAFGTVESILTSIPSASGDTLVYTTSFAPACDTGNGFVLYELCGTWACLYVSRSTATYAMAETLCKDLNATLVIANTLAKFALFWQVSLTLGRNTYLGLNDLLQEGNYLWADGSPLSMEMDSYVWVDGQPDDAGNNEDCVQARHGNWPGVFGLNDIHCTAHANYICEAD